MSEVSVVGAASLDEVTHLEITTVAMPGDSPLAKALRRRRQEVDRPEDVIASHDSVI